MVSILPVKKLTFVSATAEQAVRQRTSVSNHVSVRFMFAPPFWVQHFRSTEPLLQFIIEHIYKREIPYSLENGSSFLDGVFGALLSELKIAIMIEG